MMIILIMKEYYKVEVIHQVELQLQLLTFHQHINLYLVMLSKYKMIVIYLFVQYYLIIGVW